MSAQSELDKTRKELLSNVGIALSILKKSNQFTEQLLQEGVGDPEIGKAIADIIKTHAWINVGASFVPVPGADLAGMAANIWTMYYRINQKLGISFSEHALKSIAVGIGANIASSVPWLMGGELLKLIPGIGTLAGDVIMASVVYALTIVQGIVYLQGIALLCQKDMEVSEVNLKKAIEKVMEDKDSIKRDVQKAQEEYKQEKKRRKEEDK